MGYGKKLKEILDDKGMTVKELCRQTGNAPTTIYSIIQKDTNIRFDTALRIANVLNIPVSTLCDDIPYIKGETLPGLIDKDTPFFTDSTAKKSHVKNRTMPIIELFPIEEFPTVDRLIASFYILDDEARNEILKILDLKAETHTDAERANSRKALKRR
jgi:transcriptional regulator with XRE-family HTH domain